MLSVDSGDSMLLRLFYESSEECDPNLLDPDSVEYAELRDSIIREVRRVNRLVQSAMAKK